MNDHAYPLRIEGRIEEPLSRWMWLVKWLLANVIAGLLGGGAVWADWRAPSVVGYSYS